MSGFWIVSRRISPSLSRVCGCRDSDSGLGRCLPACELRRDPRLSSSSSPAWRRTVLPLLESQRIPTRHRRPASPSIVPPPYCPSSRQIDNNPQEKHKHNARVIPTLAYPRTSHGKGRQGSLHSTYDSAPGDVASKLSPHLLINSRLGVSDRSLFEFALECRSLGFSSRTCGPPSSSNLNSIQTRRDSRPLHGLTLGQFLTIHAVPFRDRLSPRPLMPVPYPDVC